MERLPWLVVHWALLWKIFVVFGVLVGAWLLRPRVRLGARRAARQSRVRLGPPVDSLAMASDRAQVVLRGRLKLDPDQAVARFDDERPVAVTTALPLPRSTANPDPRAIPRSHRCCSRS